MSMFMLRSALLGASAIIAVAGAHAQSGVSGRITDETGASLPGARIVVRETGQVIAADRQGEFLVPVVPEGGATLDIEYLGFAPQSIRVARGDARAMITLSRAVDGEIVVTGTILDATARALNQQRTADNQTNVVSSDSIGRFPDTNIAEALQRVPGFGVERDQGEGNFVSIRGAPVEFTSITIDGVSLPSTSPDSRAIDLGTIPSDVVSQIEVSKTLLPQQDADSIAGAVNLTTRSPFDVPRLRVSGNGGISYNELGGTSDYRAGGVLSTVAGRFGVLGSISWSQTDREVDNFESVWSAVTRPEGDEILAVVGNDFKDYNTRRQRIAATGAVEFRPDDRARFFARGTWSRRVDDEFRNLLALVYDDGVLQPGATEQRQTWNNTRIEKEFRHRIVRDQTWTLQLGGEHNLDGVVLDYSGSYTRAKQDYPQRSQLRFRSSLRPQITFDSTVDPDEPVISIFQTRQHLDVGRFAFRENTYRSQDTVQNEWAGQANARIPTQMFGQDASIQFGVRGRFRDVTVDEERFRDRRAIGAPPVPMVALLSNVVSDNFNYLLGNKFNPDSVIGYFRAQRPISQVPATRRIAQSVTADYDAREDIYAGYALARVQWPSTNVLVGARVEHTRFSGSAPAFNEPTESFTLQTVERTYTDIFPNLTIRHDFMEGLVGRLALTRAIARPNYRDIVPRLSENTDGSVAIVSVNRGNPDLKQTLSNNFDASLEYYFRPLGLVSAGFFYKDLQNYEFTITEPGTFEGLPARITERRNARDGRIIGFELAAQAQFTFLPGALRGFGVFGNLAFADANIRLPASVPGRPDRVRLPDQSRWTWNAAIFYELAGFNARLAYTKRSDYLDAFTTDPRLDSIWEGREQLDLTASADLNRNINIFFEAKNLTDSPGVRYDGVRTRVQEFEKFGRLFFFGARFNY